MPVKFDIVLECDLCDRVAWSHNYPDFKVDPKRPFDFAEHIG